MIWKWLRRIGLALIPLALVAGGALATLCAMPGYSFSGQAQHDPALAVRLKRHVAHLAGSIGERRLGKGNSLLLARRYLEAELRTMGYDPREHGFGPRADLLANVSVERKGTNKSSEIIVIGAHYDSAVGTPGANDNASGAAALLELARILRAKSTSRTVRLVFFANEEPPYFQTDLMGSLVYARECQARKDNVLSMLSLESLGHFTNEPDSQTFPWPLGLIYPSTGNFVAFIGNVGNRGLVREVIGHFRQHARIASEGFAGPQRIAGIGWSDHWSFWQAGYPAVMVTDTAPYRDPAYHEAFDTPERVNDVALSLIVAGLVGVIDELAR